MAYKIRKTASGETGNLWYNAYECIGAPDIIVDDDYGTTVLYHHDKIIKGDNINIGTSFVSNTGRFNNLQLTPEFKTSGFGDRYFKGITYERISYDPEIESVNGTVNRVSPAGESCALFWFPFYKKLAFKEIRYTTAESDLSGSYDPDKGLVYISFRLYETTASGGNILGNINFPYDWIFTFLEAEYTISYLDDPLSGGGVSGVGGTGSGGIGGGNWSAPSDNITFPTTPTVPDIMKTGLFSAYAMTTAELQTFGNYLWNGDFFDIIQKIASDPLDSIIGLSVFPFDLSTVVSESAPLKVGNATVNDLQTVSKLQTNMKTISCGSINISHYSGNAMDYAPYTKLQIYLPYIGIRDLNINDFMNSIIKVDYTIDILTGSCCAYISTVNDGVNKVLYTFTGKMSADIPISGRNYSTLIGAISTLATTGALATTLGGALPIAGATLLSASKMVANSQPQVEHSGNFNSHLSLNLLQTPYLIITRPRQSLPKSFNSFKGYPSNITERLGNLRGYTEVEYVHMDGFPNATKEEILEIETLLKSGVIL